MRNPSSSCHPVSPPVTFDHPLHGCHLPGAGPASQGGRTCDPHESSRACRRAVPTSQACSAPHSSSCRGDAGTCRVVQRGSGDLLDAGGRG
jgi:hypothetical protein